MSIIAIMIPVAISMGDPAAAIILTWQEFIMEQFLVVPLLPYCIKCPRSLQGTVATSFDGYPLAKKGKAGKALTVCCNS